MITRKYNTIFLIGNIAGYEIGAKWHWKIRTHKISVCLLVTSLLSLLATAFCFTYVWIQLDKLGDKQIELAEVTSDILKLKYEVQTELQELKRIREECFGEGSREDFADESGEDDPIDDVQVVREKRSTVQGNLLASTASSKSKDSKQSKMKKNSTTDKSFKRYHKHPSHGISLVS